MKQFGLYALVFFWMTSTNAHPGFWPVPEAFPGGPAALEATVHVFVFSDAYLSIVNPPVVAQFKKATLARLSGIDRYGRELEFDNPAPGGRVVLAETISHGSGFVVAGGRTIITAANIFSNVGHAKVMILDHRGRVILDSRFDPERVRAYHVADSVRGTKHPLAALPPRQLRIATPVTILNLDEQLPVSTIETFGIIPPPGAEAALISYPESTMDRGEYGRPDSDGTGARLSIGRMTTAHPSLVEDLARTLPDEAQRAAFVAAKVFADVDLVSGSGGGPLFNKNGVVTGLMTTRLNYGAQSAHDYAPAGGHGVSAQILLEIAELPGCEFKFL